MYRILEYDKALLPYRSDIELRMSNYKHLRRSLAASGRLSDFANAHHFYGFHRTPEGWVYREWAPAADALYLTGEFCGWDREAHPLRPIGSGNWEITLDREVIAEFIRVIYEPYYERYKSSFDGFFTDEPQISRDGIPWSFTLPEKYEKYRKENSFLTMSLRILGWLFMFIGLKILLEHLGIIAF